MPTTPNALLVDASGHTTRITLPGDPDQRTSVIRAVTSSHDLEAVDLGDNWSMWLDETGGMLGHYRRSLNPVATLLANGHGVTGGIRGPVVITGTSDMGTVPLTEDALNALEAAIGEVIDGGRATA